MTLLDLMDALQVHAAAAAIVAGGNTFTDVAVGFAMPAGRRVRIFYGGERAPEHFPDDRTLNSKLMAEAVIVRASWPVSETTAKRQRVQEGEMSTFVKEFRTRVLGDSQLGGDSVDLNLHPAAVDNVSVSGNQYAVVDFEAVIDYSEYSIQP